MQEKATAAVVPWIVSGLLIRVVVRFPLLAGHQLVQVASVDHPIDALVLVSGVLHSRRGTGRVLSGHHLSNDR